MNVYRRENLRTWLAEVGYLYVIVIVLISLFFLVKDLRHSVTSITTVDEISTSRSIYEPRH